MKLSAFKFLRDGFMAALLIMLSAPLFARDPARDAAQDLAFDLASQEKWEDLANLYHQTVAANKDTADGQQLTWHVLYGAELAMMKDFAATEQRTASLSQWVKQTGVEIGSSAVAATASSPSLPARSGFRAYLQALDVLKQGTQDNTLAGVDIALQILDKIQAEQRDEAWHVGRILVLKFQRKSGLTIDTSQEQKIISTALAAHPFSSAVAFNAAGYIDPLEPSHDDLLASILDQSQKLSASRYGSEMYARLMWVMAHRFGQEQMNIVCHQGVDWMRARIGFQELLSRYPSMHNRGNAQRFACEANDTSFYHLLKGSLSPQDQALMSDYINWDFCNARIDNSTKKNLQLCKFETILQ